MIELSEKFVVSKRGQLLEKVPGEFSKAEVRNYIESIYEKFVALPEKLQDSTILKTIIIQEVEEHPTKPVRIFEN